MACEMLLILNQRKTDREWTQKPKQTANGHEVTRIEEKTKTNRRWTQIYADKMDFLRSTYGILISSRWMVSFMILPSLISANGMITLEKSMAERCGQNYDRSRFYLRQSAFICGSFFLLGLLRVHSCPFAVPALW